MFNPFKRKTITWALALTIAAGSFVAFFKNAEAISPSKTSTQRKHNVESVISSVKKEENSPNSKQAQISESDAGKISKSLNKWAADLQLLIKQRFDADSYYQKGKAHPAMLRNALSKYRGLQESIAALGNTISDMQSTLDSFEAKKMLGRMVMECEQLVTELQIRLQEVENATAAVEARIASARR